MNVLHVYLRSLFGVQDPAKAAEHALIANKTGIARPIAAQGGCCPAVADLVKLLLLGDGRAIFSFEAHQHGSRGARVIRNGARGIA